MSDPSAEAEFKTERTPEELQTIKNMHAELMEHALKMQAERRKLITEDEVTARRRRNEDKQFAELAREIREAREERIRKHERVLREATHAELIAVAAKLQTRRAELAETMRVVKDHANDPTFRSLADEIHNFEKKKNEELRQQRAPVLSQIHAELATRSIADLRHVVMTEAEAVHDLEAEVEEITSPKASE